MRTFKIAGHCIDFADCVDVGQGGPETCSLTIDGELVTVRYLWGLRKVRRFHPSPLEWRGDILVPLRETVRFYVARVNPLTLEVRKLSRGFSYMHLLRVADEKVEFSTSAHDRDKTEFVRLE